MKVAWTAIPLDVFNAQGSIVAPTLFLIFINDIPKAISARIGICS